MAVSYLTDYNIKPGLSVIIYILQTSLKLTRYEDTQVEFG